MVLKMRYIFFFVWLTLISCGKNQFSLEFSLIQEVTDNYNVDYYATDIKGGKTVQAVASVREGKCELQGVTKLPTLVYVTPRKTQLPLVIYAVKDDKIEITGDSGNPLEWTVSGNEINSELSDWRKENIDALVSNDADSVNMAVEKYVEANRENPVATILMLNYYNREINERQYQKLIATLKGEARNTRWLELSGRSDQLVHSYAYPARFQSIILRSTDKYADTLSLDGQNSVFLLLWQTGYSRRSEIIDSIKALKKEYPDSMSLISDICLDVDSLEWRRNLRKDSLEKIKRFWVPGGVADPTMMKFKVNALPFYIVFDKEGYQKYRGKDLSKAMAEYRKLQESQKDSLNK